MELIPVDQNYYLVDGRLEPWAGPRIEVLSCFDVAGKPVRIGSYPDLDASAALRASVAAESAYDHGLGSWPMMTPEERFASVEAFTARMRTARERVVSLLVYEIAKPLADCYREFDRTVEYIEKTIVAYRALVADDARTVRHSSGLTTRIDRTPIGTALCLGPFNYPLNETLTVVIPALLTGNTVVMKPAKFGVLLFEPLLEAFRDAFPPGAINIIYGDGAKVLTPVMESGHIEVLAFIGSTRVADILERAHPEPHRLKKVLGLGAHNPSLTLPGTNLDRIMPELLAGSLSFNGQRCTTLALHYVHESQSSEYARKLAEKVRSLAFGLPWEPGVKVTALAEGPEKIRYLRELIDDAVAKGAKVVNEGGGATEGNLMIPAVLYPVNDSMRIFNEEQFGPLVPIVPYRDVSSALRAMAESRFGQQLSIFGEGSEEIARVASQARNIVARININTQCQRGPDEVPFSGRKDSAFGTLSITAALNEFSFATVIAEAHT